MFCRSCWANLPDGTEQCPKCQNDPRVPSAAAGRVGRGRSAPAAAPPPVAPGATRAARTWRRLNLALAAAARPGGGRPAADALVGGAADGAPRSPVRGRPRLSRDDARPEPTPAPCRGADGGARRATIRTRARRGRRYALYQRGEIAGGLRAVPASLAARTPARRTSAVARGVLRAAGPGRLSGRATPEAAELLSAGRRRLVRTGATGRAWRSPMAARAICRGARRCWSRRSGAFPDDPEILYLLADVQERQGRTREAVETLRRLLGPRRRARPRPDAPGAARAGAERRGRVLEPGEPALPRPLRGGRRHRGGPVGGRLPRARPTSPRARPRRLSEGAGPGRHLRDEDVRGARRHPARVRRARAGLLRLPEASTPDVGVPGGLDRARPSGPPRVHAPLDPPGHARHRAPVAPRGAGPGDGAALRAAVDRERRRPGPSILHARRARASVPLERGRCRATSCPTSSVEYLVDRGRDQRHPRPPRRDSVRGSPWPQALKEGVGVSVEDVEARLLAAGGRS